MTRPLTRREALRALVVGWLAALAVGVSAAPASAHATLLSSDPAEGEVVAEAPDVVTFTFSETVSLTDDSIQVFDAAGESVEASASGEDEVSRYGLRSDEASGDERCGGRGPRPRPRGRRRSFMQR